MEITTTDFIVTPIPKHIKYRERCCYRCGEHLFYKSDYRCVNCKRLLNKNRFNKKYVEV